MIAVLAVMPAVQPAGAFFGGGGGIKEGDAAPIFGGQTIDSQKLDYAQSKGKKVVLLDSFGIHRAAKFPVAGPHGDAAEPPGAPSASYHSKRTMPQQGGRA